MYRGIKCKTKSLHRPAIFSYKMSFSELMSAARISILIFHGGKPYSIRL